MVFPTIEEVLAPGFFVSEPSSLVRDAIADYDNDLERVERERKDENKRYEAQGILYHQIVGAEFL